MSAVMGLGEWRVAEDVVKVSGVVEYDDMG